MIHSKNRNNHIMVSVVTVVFNAKADFVETFNSVVEQDFDNYEYIVIDGGSTDGTLDAIIDRKSKIDCIISESDEGIYFAMNKAFEIAKGNWIQFLNAGDTFFNRTVLTSIFSNEISLNAIVFGKSISVYEDLMKIRYKNFRISEPNWFYERMPNHQSIFIPKSIYSWLRFDTDLKISADTKYLREAFCTKNLVYEYNDVVNYFNLGGTSNYYKNINTLKSVLKDTKELYPNNLFVFKRSLNHIVKYILQRLLSKRRYLRLYIKSLKE